MRLGQQPIACGARVVERRAQVEVHVAEHGRQVAGLAVVRLAVQEHDVDVRAVERRRNPVSSDGFARWMSRSGSPNPECDLDRQPPLAARRRRRSRARAAAGPGPPAAARRPDSIGRAQPPPGRRRRPPRSDGGAGSIPNPPRYATTVFSPTAARRSARRAPSRTRPRSRRGRLLAPRPPPPRPRSGRPRAPARPPAFAIPSRSSSSDDRYPVSISSDPSRPPQQPPVRLLATRARRAAPGTRPARRSGSRSSTGAHHRRTASPIGESKWLVPGGGGSKPSFIRFSNAARSSRRATTPWQWLSTRGRSSSWPARQYPPSSEWYRGDPSGLEAAERLDLGAADGDERLEQHRCPSPRGSRRIAPVAPGTPRATRQPLDAGGRQLLLRMCSPGSSVNSAGSRMPCATPRVPAAITAPSARYGFAL